MRHQGLASAYDCTTDRDRLNLLLVGSQPQSLKVELQSYLKLFRLPAHCRISVFTPDSSEPEEVEII